MKVFVTSIFLVSIICLVCEKAHSALSDNVKEEDLEKVISKDIQLLEKELAEELVRRAFLKGEEAVRQTKLQKQDYVARGIDKPYTELPEATRRTMRMKLQHPKAKEMEYDSIKAMAAVNELQRLTDMSLKDLSKSEHISSAWRRLVCPTPDQFNCDVSSPFRTADGSCNNIKNPEWGMSVVPQLRLIAAAYDDDLSAPRTKSKSGSKTLPSARNVSNIVLNNDDIVPTLDNKWSLMLMAWGQFLDHDISFTPSSGGEGGSGVDCCSGEKREDCFPITILDDDKYFKSKCMNFVRSSPAVGSCLPGKREQLNQITSFIDASNVYGSTIEETKSLRLFDDKNKGRLKTSPGDLPPSDSDPHAICDKKHSNFCMKCGDVRANVVPHLGANHVMFIREHNRIADELSTLNPDWLDERVFQETRKIIGAFMQHITYKEWLPAVLGRNGMDKYSLKVGSKISYIYNNSINPTVRNEFSTAALRYGHSLVPREEDYLLEDFLTFQERYPIENTFLNSDFVTQKQGADLPYLVRWVSAFPMMASDRKLEDGIRNKLFLDDDGHSFDLGALNIQRGRDHGLPSYNDYREYCGLTRAKSFEDLDSLNHKKADRQLLAKAYDHVDDIDLFPGAMSEVRAKGADVGPTFLCILGEQFKALKFGDRFWYENDIDGVTGFTKKQLKEIRKVTLAKVICNAFKEIKFVARRALNRLKDKNEDGLENDLVECNSLSGPNLSKWKEDA